MVEPIYSSQITETTPLTMEEPKYTSSQVPEIAPFRMEEPRSIHSQVTATTPLIIEEPRSTLSPIAETTSPTTEEPKSTSDTLADAIPLPILEDAPLKSHLKSNLIILVLITSGILAAYTYGFELLQAEHATWAEMGISLGLLVVCGGGVFWAIGAHKIDWWELVLGYWWFTMPIAGGVGIFLVRAMEGSEELANKS